MKRWVLVLLVGLALLVIVSPGIIGRLAERNLQESIESARDTSPEITISTERFARGWFTSEGRHRIELSDRSVFPRLARFVERSGFPGMPALIVDSRMEHGLVPVGGLSRESGMLAPGIARMESTVQFDPGNGELIDLPGKVVTEIGLSGSTHMNVDVLEGGWSDGDARAAWSGADLDVDVDVHGRVTKMLGHIGPVELASGSDVLSIGRVDVAIDRTPDSSGMMVGSVDLKTGPMTTRDEFGGELGISALTVESRNDISRGSLGADSSVILNGVNIPGLGLVDLDILFSAAGIDAETFATIAAAYREAAATSGSQGALDTIYPAMEPQLQQLLNAGGELRFERFDIMTEHGLVETDLRFSLPKTKGADAFSWPGVLLKMQATANLRMPAEFFEMVKSMNPDASKAVALGFLVPDGDGYVMAVEIDGGMAKVNGAPMQLPGEW